MNAQAGFATRLKWWRARRGMSQLPLANEAGISQRHVSFLEVGRTAPSREMVLRLAATLVLPFREQNALLRSAGFAPIWREGGSRAQEPGAVGQAIDLMLRQQEPYPAFVIDRRWNLLRANAVGRRFVAFLVDAPGWEEDPRQPMNLAEALVAPDALRPLIVNWRDVVVYFIRGVRADAHADGTEESAALLQRLLAYPDVPGLWETPSLEDVQEPVLAMHIRKGETALSLFTVLATLGAPQDVAAQEIRVESFFPADAATTEIFKRWAKVKGSAQSSS